MPTITRKVRAGFETNSSSAHTLVLDDSDVVPTINVNARLGYIDEKNQLHIVGNTEFGWEWEIWDYPGDKVNYLYLDNRHNSAAVDRLKSVLMKYTGTTDVHFDSIYEPKSFAYIDHQSEGTSAPVFELDDEGIWQFIMSTTSAIKGGNDNSDGPF